MTHECDPARFVPHIDAGSLYDLEIEQALLGAIILRNDIFETVENLVSAEDFYEQIHQALFRQFGEMRSQGTIITLALVRSSLGSSGETLITEQMTVNQYAARLAVEAVSLSQAPSYARQICELAKRRKLADLVEAFCISISSGETASKIAALGIQELDALASSGMSNSSRDIGISEAVDVAMDRMTFGLQNPGKLPGVSTGLSKLDEKTGGLRGGQLIVLAGRPGMGKSALATTMARLMATAGTSVLFYTIEMDAASIASRAVADSSFEDANVHYSSIDRGTLSIRQAEAAVEAGRSLKQLPWEFVQQAGMTVTQFAARVRKHKIRLERQGQKLGVVFVDHMQLVAAAQKYAGQRVNEITEISGSLKQLAKDLDIPVVALAQLNRRVEEREDKRPVLSDLRDSGSIEQDADTVIFVFREAYYLENSHGKNDAEEAARICRLPEIENDLEVIVAKQRSGPTGTVTLFCNIAANAVRDERPY